MSYYMAIFQKGRDSTFSFLYTSHYETNYIEYPKGSKALIRSLKLET
jgi:hypothetical protein